MTATAFVDGMYWYSSIFSAYLKIISVFTLYDYIFDQIQDVTTTFNTIAAISL